MGAREVGRGTSGTRVVRSQAECLGSARKKKSHQPGQEKGLVVSVVLSLIPKMVTLTLASQ